METSELLDTTIQTTVQPPKSNTLLYVGIGIVLLIVAIAISVGIYLYSKSCNDPNKCIDSSDKCVDIPQYHSRTPDGKCKLECLDDDVCIQNGSCITIPDDYEKDYDTNKCTKIITFAPETTTPVPTTTTPVPTTTTPAPTTTPVPTTTPAPTTTTPAPTTATPAPTTTPSPTATSTTVSIEQKQIIRSITDLHPTASICASEGGVCSVKADSNIFYGDLSNANKTISKFYSAPALGMSLAVPCSNNEFGDPAPGVVKKCAIIAKSACNTNVFGGAPWTTQMKPNFQVQTGYLPAGNDISSGPNIPLAKQSYITSCSLNPNCCGITCNNETCWLKSRYN
jgi:hypothetical protein